jgi:hypothetical protein
MLSEFVVGRSMFGVRFDLVSTLQPFNASPLHRFTASPL